MFSYSFCTYGDTSCSNSELFFSSVISLATKCAMPSFRMHLRAHGMVAMVFKTLDDSQHHQVWIDSVFYYSLDVPVYSKVKHLVQCVSGINSVIWETWRETRNKLFVSQWQIPLPLFTCFWAWALFLKKLFINSFIILFFLQNRFEVNYVFLSNKNIWNLKGIFFVFKDGSKCLSSDLLECELFLFLCFLWGFLHVWGLFPRAVQ